MDKQHNKNIALFYSKMLQLMNENLTVEEYCQQFYISMTKQFELIDLHSQITLLGEVELTSLFTHEPANQFVDECVYHTNEQYCQYTLPHSVSSSLFDKHYCQIIPGKIGNMFLIIDFNLSYWGSELGFLKECCMLLYNFLKINYLEEQGRLYRTIIENSYNSVEITNDDAIIEYVNPAFEKITLYRTEEVIGKAVSSLLRSSEVEASFFDEIRKTLADGKVWKGSYQALRKNNNLWQSKATIIPFECRFMAKKKHIAIKEDFTRIKEQAKQKFISEQKFQLILQATIDPIFVHDLNGQFVEVNQSACDKLNYSRDELLNFYVWDIETNFTPNDLNSMWQALEKSPIIIEGEHRKKDGSSFPVEIKLSKFEIDGGKLVIAMARDISEKKTYEARLKRQATIDNLTHLPNRFYGIYQLQKMTRAAREDRTKVGLMFLDLDSFKKINDTLGHVAGDKFLVRISSCLAKELCGYGIVSRLGGDEFMIIINSDVDNNRLSTIADKILKLCSEPLKVEGYSLITTVSIGISIFPDHGVDAKTLMRTADSAMYKSKSRGKNCWTIYDGCINELTRQFIQIKADIVQAFEQRDLVLEYQPIYKLDLHKIVGCEALLRWNHPRLGAISPEKAIIAAEETGLIHELGIWIIEQGCLMLSTMNQLDESLFLSLNVSPNQLNNDLFSTQVLNKINSTRVSPKNLILEFTENTLLHHSLSVLNQMEELSCAGVRCAIDDFGTGYSSLNYLQKYPFSCLKIDKTFTRGLTKSDSDINLIESIIKIGESLNLLIIAEGVETCEEVEKLTKLSCLYAQGWFFDSSMTGMELIGRISREANS